MTDGVTVTVTLGSMVGVGLWVTSGSTVGVGVGERVLVGDRPELERGPEWGIKLRLVKVPELPSVSK